MRRRTRKMIEVEGRYLKPLVEMLPQMLTSQGLAKTALELGVSKATIGIWMAKLGIELRYVALRPGESITIIEVEPKPTKPFARIGAWLGNLRG
jgi:hypothetical protein